MASNSRTCCLLAEKASDIIYCAFKLCISPSQSFENLFSPPFGDFPDEALGVRFFIGIASKVTAQFMTIEICKKKLSELIFVGGTTWQYNLNFQVN